MQVVENEEMQVYALDQWTRDIPLQGERGCIYDKNGRLLVTNQTTYTVYVRPNAVTDKERAASFVADLFDIRYEYVYSKITSRKGEVTLKKGATKEEITAIREQNLVGFYFSQNVARKYVYGNFLSQVLGFTNIDCVGQTGLEMSLNSYLTGKNGSVLTEADLIGRELESNKTYYISGKKGNTVYLTVEYGVQRMVENTVNEAYNEHKAKSASCIVMDVQTGEILAMAQAPNYDLNNLPRNNVAELLSVAKNTLIGNVYEPGSTFKMLTASIGLEEKVVSLNTHVYCGGNRVVDGTKIKCWKTIGHGSQTFSEGVQNSCNCLFMDIALKLGTEKLYAGLKKFGIVEKTGIELKGEGNGLMISQEVVKNVDIARMGFGQAVAVTAIELITACSTVVNGGYLLQPYIVDRIADTQGNIVLQGNRTVKRQVIGEETSKTMREVLWSVVEEGGGKNAQVQGYKIGGKTGTAQKYENGRIAQGKYVATFVGFAPADNPKYILLFIVDEPSTGAYYGSVVAAPYASKIYSELLPYFGYAKEGEKEAETMIMPDLIGKGLSQADTELREKGLTYEICEEKGEEVLYQIPAPGSEISKNTVVYLYS